VFPPLQVVWGKSLRGIGINFSINICQNSIVKTFGTWLFGDCFITTSVSSDQFVQIIFEALYDKPTTRVTFNGEKPNPNTVKT
jgi:hypothetical protein